MTDLPIIDIAPGLSAYLASKKRRFPQTVNRISALDDPCLRRLYYMRAAWDKAAPTDDGLQSAFETGNILEPVIERLASEIGQLSTPIWRIVGTQTTTNDALLREYQISGTIDGFLQVQRPGSQWETVGVVDIKTMSPNIYPRVNTFDDLARYPWTARYRGQLMLYALAHNLERCCLLLVNKSSLLQMKMLWFTLDMAYCEGLLQKAKAVNAAIAENVPPCGVNDPEICPDCQWFSYCCPDMASGGNLKFVNHDGLAFTLDRLAELEPAAAELKDLESARDEMLVKGENIQVGRWIITWKQSVNGQWRKKIVQLPL